MGGFPLCQRLSGPLERSGFGGLSARKELARAAAPLVPGHVGREGRGGTAAWRRSHACSSSSYRALVRLAPIRRTVQNRSAIRSDPVGVTRPEAGLECGREKDRDSDGGAPHGVRPSSDRGFPRRPGGGGAGASSSIRRWAEKPIMWRRKSVPVVFSSSAWRSMVLVVIVASF